LNQLYEISRSESIPLEEVTSYIKQKLDEKQKIDEGIKQADSALQSKNMSIEAINEHLKLNEEFDKYGLSTHDIDKLLNLLSNAKRYGFDGKEIAAKSYAALQIGIDELIALKAGINQAAKLYKLPPLAAKIRPRTRMRCKLLVHMTIWIRGKSLMMKN
jgi:hypothetical protein